MVEGCGGLVIGLLAAVHPTPKEVIDALLSPLTVYASATAFAAGIHAVVGLFQGWTGAEITDAISFGIARGFIAGTPFAAFAFGVALGSLQHPCTPLCPA